jgi:DNA-binding transcriptional LysR family regulator
VVRVGTLKDSGLIARPLGKLSIINCASPDYLARFGYPESLDDLSRMRLCITPSTSARVRKALKSASINRPRG